MLAQQYTLEYEPLKVYCFDTSTFIELWNVTHRPKTFPSLWKDIEKIIGAKKIISSVEVLNELQARDDDLFAWAVKNKQGFLPIDRIQIEELQKIHIEIENVGHKGRIFDADPWILALGRTKNAYVVSSEKHTGDKGNPRIPDACKFLNIPYIRSSDVFEIEGLSY